MSEEYGLRDFATELPRLWDRMDSRMKWIEAQMDASDLRMVDDAIRAIEAAEKERDELREAVREMTRISAAWSDGAVPNWLELPAVKRALEAEVKDAD